MFALILTLGHNSSAILVEDGNILAGYEEERLSGEKSDSRFPINAIRKLIQLYDLPIDISICVSHWFLDGNLPDEDNKYWNRSILKEFFPEAKYYGLNIDEITHHHAHALSAQVFAGENFPKNYHILVMDGFGTEGECMTMYERRSDYTLKKTGYVYGFMQSLGLLYQYATDFCKMKMHQHEYKMLAYETHITELISKENIGIVNNRVDEWVNLFIRDCVSSSAKEFSLITLELTHRLTDLLLLAYLASMKQLCNIDVSDIRNVRILVAYFVQRTVEKVVGSIVMHHHPENLLVVGGLFYNVKLNSLLCDMVPGKFCVMPLAGDQGAGLGVYQYHFGDLKWPGHLFWGTRDLGFTSSIKGMVKMDSARGLISDKLKGDGIVNLVRGSMEFGPRALCNTSTFALPTLVNAEIINKMNDRTNEMPFALVVTEDQAKDLFEDIDKVHRSLEYMIVTRRFKKGRQVGLEGGAHYYPLQDLYTCRPQITHDPMMVSLLKEFGPLINTSFNYHGQPIVYDRESIEAAHENESKYYDITTIVEAT